MSSKLKDAVNVLVDHGQDPEVIDRFLMGSHTAGVQLCHGLAVQAGWWSDLTTGEPIKRSYDELFCLIISELYEGFEGYRKGLNDDHLPHYPMLDVELADFLIRFYDAAGGCGIKLSDASPRYETHYKERTTCEYILEITVRAALLHEHSRNDQFTTSDTIVRSITALLNQLSVKELGSVEKLYEIAVEKLAYNLQRADHKREARLVEGGKKI